MSGFCPTCGAQRTGERFCAKCGADFAPTTMRQDLARGALQVQHLNSIVVVGRLVGIALALAVWWFVLGPTFGAEQPLLVIGSFFVMAAAGIYVGQWATLALLAR